MIAITTSSSMSVNGLQLILDVAFCIFRILFLRVSMILSFLFCFRYLISALNFTDGGTDNWGDVQSQQFRFAAFDETMQDLRTLPADFKRR